MTHRRTLGWIAILVAGSGAIFGACASQEDTTGGEFTGGNAGAKPDGGTGGANTGGTSSGGSSGTSNTGGGGSTSAGGSSGAGGKAGESGAGGSTSAGGSSGAGGKAGGSGAAGMAGQGGVGGSGGQDQDGGTCGLTSPWNSAACGECWGQNANGACDTELAACTQDSKCKEAWDCTEACDTESCVDDCLVQYAEGAEGVYRNWGCLDVECHNVCYCPKSCMFTDGACGICLRDSCADLCSPCDLDPECNALEQCVYYSDDDSYQDCLTLFPGSVDAYSAWHSCLTENCALACGE